MSTATQPPATPTYILRGHSAAIHALQIFANNLRLISGDANGWIIVWDLIFKRPVAVWKAHEGAVLEVKGFSLGDGKVTEVYTHGRDHKLRVWKFRVQDEEILQKTLPVDAGGQPASESQSQSQIQPWLVHSLYVNALNFCAFSLLSLASSEVLKEGDKEYDGGIIPSSALIAVPNALDSGAIDLFHLPSERRICTIPTDPAVKTGMVMAVRLTRTLGSNHLHAAAAFEDGHVMVSTCRSVFQNPKSLADTSRSWKWERLYLSRPHSQPVLSIDLLPSGESFLSSSADAILAKHSIRASAAERDTPLKSVNTKHAGQQGIRVRSDGKIFATAGWDSRVRVYSCKTMKELAVLKWHKEGCYAVAFADVSSTATPPSEESSGPNFDHQLENEAAKVESGTIRRGTEYSLVQVQRQRSLKVQNTHWLVAGSKDGKISLWDIY
ncbi:WD40 repeat domain-containing protein [Aspergillus undulatus]|uniref:WD40 repeat domain-containing protein n=1 Tax=Aspergillus undulatus TaxID=1810928 RepID=UPI003CCCA7AB